MQLFGYIKSRLLFHIIVILLYSALAFVLLLTVGEIIHDYGYDSLGVNETTYSFRFYTNDRNTIESVIASINDFSDVCVVCEEDKYNLVSFVTEVSDIRSSESQEISKGHLKYSSEYAFNNAFSEEYDSNKNTILINNESFICDGEMNINISLPLDNDVILFSNYDDFWNMTDREAVIVSVLFDRRLSDSELAEINMLFSSTGNIVVCYRPEYISFADKMLNSDEIRLIYLIFILAGLFFARLMVVIINDRRAEYNIMRFCGASLLRIYFYILEHVLFILFISGVAGSAAYWLISASLPGFIMYSNHNIVFYLINFSLYMVITIFTSYILILVKGSKNEY